MKPAMIPLGFYSLIGVFFFGGHLAAQSQSSLVYPGPDGRLVYEGYANRDRASTDNTIPDFSHVGYRGGGVAIPWVPVAVTLDPLAGTDDDHARIQAAIDQIAAMPLSSAGFRGTLLLRAGTYHVSETLFIRDSGIVIRGQGQQDVGGTKIIFTATVKDNLFEVRGSSGWSEVVGTRQTITDFLVPVGATSFTVQDASGFSPGDTIRTRHKMNDTWISDLGMDQLSSDPNDGVNNWNASGYQLQHERTVTAVDGNTVHVDTGFMQAVEDQYGGAEIFNVTARQISNVGFESLRLESSFTFSEDEAHGWNAIYIRNLRDGWVRRVTGRYFGYSAVNIQTGSQYITVEDCANLDPISITTGGRKYSFYVDNCSYVLMQRLYTRGGRHDFVSGSRTPGPHVFVDALAENTFNDTGPHHRYSTGQLYDNVRAGEIHVQNRTRSGSGHGWAGAQILFWNCEAESLICEAPPGAMNWAIGCTGTRRNGLWKDEPDGIWESQNVPVTPRSLYYKQLEERLGTSALLTVTTANQRSGGIWDELSTWRGDSAPPGVPAFAPVQVDAGDASGTTIGEPLALNAVVHNPLPANFPVTGSGWAVLSGPASVTFGDSGSASTTATFSQTGTYELQYSSTQEDDSDPQNVITYNGSDVLIVRISMPPLVDAGLDQIVSASAQVPWTPDEITTLAWYDASDAGTIIASGRAVLQWNDKSPNNRDLVQGTGARQPETGIRMVNGLNALDFIGDFMDAATTVDLNGGMLIAAFVKDDALTVSFANLAAANTQWSITGTKLRYATTAPYWPGNTVSSRAFSTGQSTVAGWIGESSLAYTVNGHYESSGTGNDGSGSTSYNRIGAREANGGGFFNGAIGEIIAVPTIDAATRERIEGFLAHKWGSAGHLPTAHPYKAAAPGAAAAVVTLAGTASDPSGLPLTHAWTVISGPGQVGFADAGSLATTATFTAEGHYTLRLTSDNGTLSSFDEVLIFIGDVPPSTPFEDWSGGSESGISFAGDSNADGLADGLAWLLGAADPSAAALATLSDGNAPTLTFNYLIPSARGTATLSLQHSGTLAAESWITVEIPASSGTVDGADFILTPIPDSDLIEVQVSLPEVDGRIFVRLRGEL